MKLILFILLFSSCAKISYMAKQGFGQVALEWNGKDNKKVLADPNVSSEHKRKIEIVRKAKKYFFNELGFKSNSIYDQTTFLDQKAVSYLIIHSADDKIEAEESCFIIAGCFPYQGFFSKESAISFKEQKEDLGFHTYMRPVYAYSTLNHPLIPFNDNILSSFFHYKDKQLIHLIFHELVHTIIFVKDEAQFNENLAEFIADKMLVKYLDLKPTYNEQRKVIKEKHVKLNQQIVVMGKELNELYKKKGNSNKNILRNFIQNQFIPMVTNYCKVEGLEKCWPLKEKWNNARFAAFATYVAKRNQITEVYKQMNLSLKQFLIKLIELEDSFNHDNDFIEYIKNQG